MPPRRSRSDHFARAASLGPRERRPANGIRSSPELTHFLRPSLLSTILEHGSLNRFVRFGQACRRLFRTGAVSEWSRSQPRDAQAGTEQQAGVGGHRVPKVVPDDAPPAGRSGSTARA